MGYVLKTAAERFAAPIVARLALGFTAVASPSPASVSTAARAQLAATDARELTSKLPPAATSSGAAR
jgi:hypothetical protein